MFSRSISEAPIITAENGWEMRSLHNPQRDKTNFDHFINHCILESQHGVGVTTNVKGAVIYIFEGRGELCTDAGTVNLNAKQFVYLPPKTTLQIINSNQSALKILQIHEQGERTQVPENSEDPVVLDTHKGFIFETGAGYFLRDQLHPEYNNKIKIPFCVGDSVVQPGKETPWKNWKVSVCEVVTEGSGLLYIGNNEPQPIKAGQMFNVPESQWWKVKSDPDSELCFLGILNHFWKPEYDQSSEGTPPL